MKKFFTTASTTVIAAGALDAGAEAKLVGCKPSAAARLVIEKYKKVN
jgi:hypothetical protein